MSLDNPKGTESSVSKNISQRRKFLKRASAGVVVSSMPAQSVWGACNASGISGGSGSTTTCDEPILSGGRSPGSWGKFLTETPDGVALNKVDAMFSSAGASELGTYYCKLYQYILNKTVTLSHGLGAIPEATLDLHDALSDNGGIWNLAAFYLNARFGFYNIPLEFWGASDEETADNFIEHVWGVLWVSNGNNPPTNFDGFILASFTDGVTANTLSDLTDVGSCVIAS